jgi:glycine/D-amino acid oxidase-like deaminating enzyme
MLNGQVSHWWHEIGVDTPRAPLPGDIDVDVAIVGAGYTGLWTAYYLKLARPDIRIAVIEQQHVGYGASGRNGGWLTNAITGGREHYEKTHGRATAEAFQVAMNDTVDEVIAVAKAEHIDADIHKGGELTVAYNAAQEARLRSFALAEQQWASTDVQLLESADAAERVAVADVRAAAWHPHAARIHPAKLARGLAQAVEKLGVTIYEQTTALTLRKGAVTTSRGTVRAEFVVRATEGFTANFAEHHREWLPMNSSLIATEPLPASVWNDIGWSNREVLGDMAHVYMYAQRTADDRIAIGGRGVPYKYGSRTDTDGQTPDSTRVKLQQILHRMFPATREAQIDHVWSGVLGVPRDWFATVGLDRSTGIGWAGGYVGTGVTSTNLAGRTLSALISGEKNELTALPWVDHRARKWEPEPLRWMATKALYGMYGEADRLETSGRTTTPVIARLADIVAGR